MNPVGALSKGVPTAETDDWRRWQALAAENRCCHGRRVWWQKAGGGCGREMSSGDRQSVQGKYIVWRQSIGEGRTVTGKRYARLNRRRGMAEP
ncbi:hypothetical protein [Sodalis glossinidius]|uniref:hypothetical protein n=1 Tax=Sodalis glossinidius TaxID=63612 RepID=UPI00130528EB|nr:hypothetical protein [Sodalis glossinidius]